MKKVGVALLGLGTVGGGTYRILRSMHDDIMASDGVDIEIRRIIERDKSKAEALGVDPTLLSEDINDVISDPEIKVVAEFFGGIEPARSFLIASLKAGKSIVTANKEMFSKCMEDLKAAAIEGNAGLYFEASCVGGVPVIRALTESMQGNRLDSIMGIVNGTTNYILTKMSDEGLEYEDVLKEAQRLGYAEANPTADVDGFDSMYKLSILSTLCFRKHVPLEKIYREGISKISKTDIEFGKRFGYTLKLLAIGKLTHGKIEARVHPAFILNDNPLSSVKGSFNAVMLHGNNVGDVMLYGRGAGDLPTGSAIVSDIVYAAVQDSHRLFSYDSNVTDDDFADDFTSEYYVRMTVMDKAGVLAKIAAAFGKYGVSINSVQQQAEDGKACIIFMIHRTSESALNRAAAEISSLNEVYAVNTIIRVI